METINEIIGQNVYGERKKRNISQEEFAKQLKIELKYLSLAERGKVGFSVAQLLEVSKIFHATLEELCTQKDWDKATDSK